MNVNNHRLMQDDGSPVSFTPSPSIGSAVSPLYLIIHYTAGRDFKSSVSWLTNPKANASAHLVIGRDGQVEQLVPFNRIAWHAGKSKWGELEGMNRYSIGIELDNAGRLNRNGQGKWSAWFGETYDDKDVIQMVHKHEVSAAGWHTYTQVQMETLIAVATALNERYRFAEILGHDDVAPGRKSDPGPAFPMTSFSSIVLGRRD
jgi:N-acetylmuramoyl-L-alanine amidase